MYVSVFEYMYIVARIGNQPTGVGDASKMRATEENAIKSAGICSKVRLVSWGIIFIFMFTIIFSLLLFWIVAGVFHGCEVSVGCDVGRIYLVVSCQKRYARTPGKAAGAEEINGNPANLIPW